MCRHPSLTPGGLGRGRRVLQAMDPRTQSVPIPAWAPGLSSSSLTQAIQGKPAVSLGIFWQLFGHKFTSESCEPVRRAPLRSGSCPAGLQAPLRTSPRRKPESPLLPQLQFGSSLSSCRVSMSVSSALDRTVINRAFCPLSGKASPRRFPKKYRKTWTLMDWPGTEWGAAEGPA